MFDAQILLKKLEFGRYFVHSSRDDIPNSVTHLLCSGNFTDPIEDCIPKSVTNLTFYDNYKSELCHKIPATITHLTLGQRFSKSACGYIPNSVTHLAFGRKHTGSIKNCIPSSVTHIAFAKHYGRLIDTLPETVKYIYVHQGYTYDVVLSHAKVLRHTCSLQFRWEDKYLEK